MPWPRRGNRHRCRRFRRRPANLAIVNAASRSRAARATTRGSGSRDLNPARLKLTDLTGAASGQERTIVLAGGRLFPDEATASASTSLLGQLTTATVHQNLTGLGRPSALVGSSDGFLYAVDPCAAALDFTFEFGSAVGEAITGDTDGDGRDEILVTVQDGYLYTLRNFELAPPPVVRDTDPFSDAPDDLSELQTESTLEATWDPVDAAEHYEVAVVDAAGAYVGTPWQNAGLATTFLFTDLPLVDGFYRVTVRAVRADAHHSVDTVSDGVWVTIGPPLPTSDGGCCDSAGSPTSALVLFLVTGALLLRRRRATA